MSYKVAIYNNVDYKQIDMFVLSYIPPINTYLIIGNNEYIVLDYILTDYELDIIKMVVRKANNNDIKYINKIL